MLNDCFRQYCWFDLPQLWSKLAATHMGMQSSFFLDQYFHLKVLLCMCFFPFLVKDNLFLSLFSPYLFFGHHMVIYPFKNCGHISKLSWAKKNWNHWKYVLVEMFLQHWNYMLFYRFCSSFKAGNGAKKYRFSNLSEMLKLFWGHNITWCKWFCGKLGFLNENSGPVNHNILWKV